MGNLPSAICDDGPDQTNPTLFLSTYWPVIPSTYQAEHIYLQPYMLHIYLNTDKHPLSLRSKREEGGNV